jgi:ribosomal protein S21
LENALKEFKQIEKQEEVLQAKHEKEEIHIEEADGQVEHAIE